LLTHAAIDSFKKVSLEKTFVDICVLTDEWHDMVDYAKQQYVNWYWTTKKLGGNSSIHQWLSNGVTF